MADSSYHRTTPARPRWLSAAADLVSSACILAGIAILTYALLALELEVTA